MNKAVFLDRDGTINIDKEYLYRIEDFEFTEGTIDALKQLQDMGYLLFIITNQSGIGRGYYSEEDFHVLNTWMIEKLMSYGVIIQKVYYCPHHPQAKIDKYRTKCNCRKPATGLFKQAVEEYKLDLSLSFSIGDKLRDCSICFKTDCQGFLIGNTEDPDIIREVKLGKYNSIQYASDVKTCVEMIKDKEKN